MIQLVDEHPEDKGIERNAAALMPSDDVVQPQSLVPIVHHQHVADCKRFNVVRRNLRRAQPGLTIAYTL